MISMGLKSMKTSDTGGICDRGFTLIELLVALAVASILMAAIYSVNAGLTRSYTTQNAAADAQQAVRATIDLMAEDIMMAGLDSQKKAFDTIQPIQHADSTKLWIRADRNMNGEIDDFDLEMITYVYNPGADTLEQILYEDTVKKDAVVFMDNVTEFSFTYLDADGDPPAVLDDIRTVVISMKVAEPAGRKGTVEREYTTRVKCRNLGLDD
jgi:type IV pilus assembly protein PilW